MDVHTNNQKSWIFLSKKIHQALPKMQTSVPVKHLWCASRQQNGSIFETWPILTWGVFALEMKDDSGNDAPKFCSTGRTHKGPIAKELLGLGNKVQKKLKEPTLHVKNVLKGSMSSSKELAKKIMLVLEEVPQEVHSPQE